MMNALLIHAERLDGAPPDRHDGWWIGGVRQVSSAAKFWPVLLDEVFACFPSCTQIELSVLSADQLDGGLLDPAKILAAELEENAPRDTEQELRRLVGELEIAGPPPAVRVRLLDEATCLYDDALPLEAADSEIFMYLLAWLLTWAGVPEFMWQQERLSDSFCAENLVRSRRYCVVFELEQSPAHEGLTRRVLNIRAAVA